jgi:hypothetical protein
MSEKWKLQILEMERQYVLLCVVVEMGSIGKNKERRNMKKLNEIGS